MKNPLFYAKVLLFGEYGIIENAKGLTIPYNSYQGTLQFQDNKDIAYKDSNQVLIKYLAYLKTLKNRSFNLAAFSEDINKGMCFNSTIPQGYGVGSSGALVAAIYDKYAVDKIDVNNAAKKSNIGMLKKLFGEMESFFHGKSSGIDPLICYLNIPLLIGSKTNIDVVGLEENKLGKGAIFLVNSGSPGETAPMVELFFQKLKAKGFRALLKNEFIKYNNACIDSFVKGEFKSLFQDLKKLSSWAFVHFRPMIPVGIIDLWEKGIDTESYYLKLCGSGGGGYVLGFTEDFEKAKPHLNGFDTEVIYRF